MNSLAKLALSGLLAFLWIALIVLGNAYLLRRGPARLVTAGVAGVSTGIIVLLGIGAGLAPNLADNQPQSWLVVAAIGLAIFVVALVWTYIGPALYGATWEEMMKSVRAAATMQKENDHKQEDRP